MIGHGNKISLIFSLLVLLSCVTGDDAELKNLSRDRETCQMISSLNAALSVSDCVHHISIVTKTDTVCVLGYDVWWATRS